MSLLAFGILTNLLTDVFKFGVSKLFTSSKFIAKGLSKKAIKIAIEGLELEYGQVKKLKENPTEEMVYFIRYLYHTLLTIILFSILYFIFVRINEKGLLYPFYGLAANQIFKIIITLVHNSGVIEKCYDFSKYKPKVLERIKMLKKLIEPKID